ncbi:hypothetical protein D3Z58_21455 [Clostridiaceae bacterium]|nr:hypothetical protein [Clostridiaceae bacterium]
MDYILYGNNRIAKDFRYLFDDLNIISVSDDIESILSDYRYDQIIICDFDKSQKEEELKKRGLVYGTDYVYEEDFFPSLDSISIPKDRKIAVWGTGNRCKFLLSHNLPWEPDLFIDSYKKQDTFMNVPVAAPENIMDWSLYFVIIAVEKDQEIRDRLSGCGLKEKEDYMGFQQFLELPSVLLRQTIFDQAYYDLQCKTMENHLEILEDGKTRCCCTTFVSQGLDNIFEKDLQELWHSKLHKIMCLSTENRTFSFCDKTMCPLFVGKKMEKDSLFSKREEPYGEIAPFPETLALGYDSSCNLSCITCRKGVHFAKGEELACVNKITEQVIHQYLPQCKFLILAGSGEVFASPAYGKVYESKACNPKYIRLLSNGTLFTPENWKHFKEGKSAKIMLTVSVDATTKETYSRIRRGDFDALRKNMEFASELRKKEELCYFRMNFVVQRENYKEMVPFVEWGKELGVDELFFTKILNWGTYTAEEFAQVSMMEEDGVTPKPELREVMEHPVMSSDLVDMGTIQFAHKVDEVNLVENYYMWELEKRGGKLFD